MLSGILQKIKYSIASIFSRGLTRTLFIAFFLISLVPVTIVSIVSFNNAQDTLRQESLSILSTITENKKNSISALFEELAKNINLQSQLKGTTGFIYELKAAYIKSGKSLQEFTKSFSWVLLADEYSADLIRFQDSYLYDNVLLIDDSGNVLYATEGGANLGENIFTGVFSNSKFSVSARKTLETGETRFSDFDYSSTIKKEIIAFISKVIVNDDGDKIGVIAIQIPQDKINRTLEIYKGSKATLEVYLVGRDGLMRSQSRFLKENTALKRSVKTKATIEWLNQGKQGNEDNTKEVYINFRDI